MSGDNSKKVSLEWQRRPLEQRPKKKGNLNPLVYPALPEKSGGEKSAGQDPLKVPLRGETKGIIASEEKGEQ